MFKKQKVDNPKRESGDTRPISNPGTSSDQGQSQSQDNGHDHHHLDYSAEYKALGCHLIQKLILSLLNFKGLLSLRGVNRTWYHLVNAEIRKRGGLALQFNFDPVEKEYEHVPPPVKFTVESIQVESDTPDESRSSSGSSTSSSCHGENNSSENQEVNCEDSPQKMYLRDLVEILGSAVDLDFPCTHFTFTGGDLKMGRAREFFCLHGEWIDTLILRNVSPSEETFVSLLQCQAPNVVKLSLSLDQSMKDSDWVPEERRYLLRDPSKPPVLQTFRVDLEPLMLPALEILHFGEQMQKRDWRWAVAYQIVARASKLKAVGNFPLFQFHLPFWHQFERKRIPLLHEFTIYKPMLLFPCPQPPPGMTVPIFREQQRIAAQIRAEMRERQLNPEESVQIVVRIANQNQTPGQVQGQGQGQNLVQALLELDDENPERGSNAAFVRGVKAYKDFGKFNRENFKLKKLTFDLSQRVDPSIDPTIVHTTRHLIPDYDRIFTTSQESLQILEWEYVDTIPGIPGGYPNVHRLTVQVDTRPEQTFKTEVVRDLFPQLKSIGLNYLRTSGMYTLRAWHNYFTPSNQTRNPNDPAVTSLDSVEELELSDDFPCTRSWDKFRQIFPNLKRIKSYAAVTTPHHGIFFVYWPQLQSIEWAGRYKMTGEESRRLIAAKQTQLDSRTLETLDKMKRERQEKELWTPEPTIFGGFELRHEI